jgi:hypothetical protein
MIFRARFVPSVIVTLPIISAIIALFLPARQLYGLLIGPVLEVVLVLVLVRVARDEGKKIEPQLIKQWDGLPTTRYLRHRNDELENPTRERYRATLSKLTGLSFPCADDVEGNIRLTCSGSQAFNTTNRPDYVLRAR